MQRIVGNCKKGILFIVSAPAGTGKTTLVRMLCDEFECVYENISYTTRPARPNEVSGRDYHYIGTDEFEKRIKKKDFLEYAKVFDHYYGTSKRDVEGMLRAGKHVFLIIDTQGALQLKKKTDAVFIFIRPPHLSELRKRLESRKSDSREAIEKRLSWAEEEIARAAEYDYQIVNDQLQTAYQILRAIVIAEEHRTKTLE